MSFKVKNLAEQVEALGLSPKQSNGNYPLKLMEGYPRSMQQDAVVRRQLTAILQPRIYAPIPEPKEGDWLSRGNVIADQSFANYSRSPFNRPDKRRSTIYLLPLGGDHAKRAYEAHTSGEDVQFDEAGEDGQFPSLSVLQLFVQTFFGLKCVVLPPQLISKLPGKIAKRDNLRKQYNARDILQALKVGLPADAYCLAAVTMADIFPSADWNFVFGLGSLAERVGVFSFCRYDPCFYKFVQPETICGLPNPKYTGAGPQRVPGDAHLLLRRSSHTLVHEIGHMFGLQHCTYFKCLMQGSNGLEESDAAPMWECPVCLRKLHFALHFDIAQRYQALLDLCSRYPQVYEEAIVQLQQRIAVLTEQT